MEEATVRLDQSEGDSCWKQCSSSLPGVCEEKEEGEGGEEGGGGGGEERGGAGGEINRSDNTLRQEQVFKDNSEDTQEERKEQTINCESLGRGDAQQQELDIDREHNDQERLDEKDISDGEKEDGETMETDMCSAEGTGGCTSVTVYGYLCEEAPHLVARSSCCVFTKNRDNFFKGCKWSPDGSCVLTCSNDCFMRLFNLPVDLYTAVEKTCLEMTPAVAVKEGELVYDFCWYPHMSSYYPETCCFASCSRDAPVHLWDAYSGHLRASYVAYNHLDEVVAPYSVAFSCDGATLYTGFRNFVKVFDTSRPGRECTTIATYDKGAGGQKGMISCIAAHPSSSNTYALGSYSCSIALYSESVQGPICMMSGLQSGITHLLFSPCGNFLFSGERKSSDILCWDLRNPGKVLQRLERTVTTNQRIYFDIDRSGCYLISGSTDGSLLWWDLRTNKLEQAEGREGDDGVHEPAPTSVSKGHNDAVNGCSLHPVLPLLATTSGQWTFPPTSDSEEEEEEERGDSGSVDFENTLKLWSLQGQRTGPYLTV